MMWSPQGYLIFEFSPSSSRQMYSPTSSVCVNGDVERHVYSISTCYRLSQFQFSTWHWQPLSDDSETYELYVVENVSGKSDNIVNVSANFSIKFDVPCNTRPSRPR